MTSRTTRIAPAGALLGLMLPALAVTPAGAAPAAPAPVAATSGAATVGYAQIEPVPGTLLPQTKFTVTGVLGNKLPRTVQLVHTSGGSTRTIATTTSSAAGTFTFDGASAPSTGTLTAVSPQQTLKVAAGTAATDRHRAAVRKVDDLVATVRKRSAAHKKATAALARAAQPRRKTSGKKMGQLLRKVGSTKNDLKFGRKALARARDRVKVTQGALVRTVVVPRAEAKPVTVTVAPGQTSSVAALPPIAQAGPTAAAPPTGAVVSARFTPPRPGREVRLLELVGGSWQTVQTQPQDRSGHAVFSTAAGRTYRAATSRTSEAEEVETSPVTTRAWAPEFSDTFDGTGLDGSKWEVQHRPRNTGLRSCAVTDGSSYSVGGGVLKLGVSADPAHAGKTCAYTDAQGVEHQLPFMRNTQIATLGRYAYTYGFAAARIKVQSAIGMHSSFWSQPTTETVPGRPASGIEVDVMEYFGDYPREDGIAAFQHVLQANKEVVKAGRMFPETALMKADAPFSSSYHVFSLEWTENSYVFRMDGREFHRTTQDISQVNQYLLLSNLTSSYELVNLRNPADVAAVDWVQVWR